MNNEMNDGEDGEISDEENSLLENGKTYNFDIEDEEIVNYRY